MYKILYINGEIGKMEETPREKRSWKWLLIIPVVGVLIFAGVLGYQYLTTNEIPLALPDLVVDVIPTTTTPVSFTITGSEVFNGQVVSEEFIELSAGRYDLSFQSDNDVAVSLRRGPRGYLVCCNNNIPTSSGVYRFDINSGAGGNYELKVAGANPTSYVTISQVLAF